MHSYAGIMFSITLFLCRSSVIPRSPLQRLHLAIWLEEYLTSMASHGEQRYKLHKRYYNGYSPEIVGDKMLQYMSKSVSNRRMRSACDLQLEFLPAFAAYQKLEWILGRGWFSLQVSEWVSVFILPSTVLYQTVSQSLWWASCHECVCSSFSMVCLV